MTIMKYSTSLCLLLCLIWLLTTEAAKVRKLNRAKSAKGNNGRGHAFGRQDPDAQREAEIDALIDQVSAPETDHNKKSSKDNKGNRLVRRGQKSNKEQGSRVTRMQQTYEDLPVFGAEIVNVVQEARTVRLKDKGTKQFTGKTKRLEAKEDTQGTFIDGLAEDLRPHRFRMRRMRPNRALRKLRRSEPKGEMFNCKSMKMIYVDPESMEAIPAYYASCFMVPRAKKNKPNVSQPTMILDMRFNVITKWNDLRTSGMGPGGNAKTGTYAYGVDRPFIPVTEVAGNCEYKTADVRTVDVRADRVNGWNSTLWETHSPPCYTYQGDSINGAASPLNDAHYFAVRTIEMYKEWYGEPPYTNDIVQKVHHGYGVESMNAFATYGYHWKFYGTFWRYERIYVTVFGDGGSWIHPFTSHDQVAHEHGHTVTFQNSHLNNFNQSGGICEAFSDMASKAAEFFEYGSVQSWCYGSDVVKIPGYCFRCMDDPSGCSTSVFGSIDNIAQYTPNMGVHTSAGIFNKVFYEMSTTLPYGPWDAFDIFYMANKHKWTSTTGFVDGAQAVMEIIRELQAGQHLPWGYAWVNIDLVVNAFNAVGITCDKSTLTCV